MPRPQTQSARVLLRHLRHPTPAAPAQSTPAAALLAATVAGRRPRPRRYHSTTRVDVTAGGLRPCTRHAVHGPKTPPGYSCTMPSSGAAPVAHGAASFVV